MFRLASTLSCLLLAGGAASAQSFQTALPLEPAERRAMESRLSTILDYAAPGEVRRFTLPTGRVLAVLTYRPVREPGEEPCRGYRIDLLDERGIVAVDGFRCRRSDGNAWLIVEPEIVLAQEGAPLDLRGATSPRQTDEPFEIGPPETGIIPPRAEPGPDDSAFFEPGEAAPVPRPAPRVEIRDQAEPAPAAAEEEIADAPEPTPEDAAETDDATEEEPPAAETVAVDVAPADGERQVTEAAAGPAAETVAEPALETVAEDIAAAPLPPADDPAEASEQDAAAQAASPASFSERIAGTLRNVTPTNPAAPEDAPESAVAVGPGSGAAGLAGPDAPGVTVLPAPDAGDAAADESASAGVRSIGEEAEVDRTGFSGDPRILAGLRDLAYLPRGPGSPPAARVREAVDAFARDERLTLPVSADALAAQLDAAVARREELPACGEAPAEVPCVMTE